MEQRIRCPWPGTDELYCRYHDEEWGRPVHDDRHLFEMIVLDGMQAGLSWLTILRKRENFRRAFDNFDVDKIQNYDDAKVEALMQDSGIIRNRLKIKAAVTNAIAFRAVQQEFGSFDAYIWGFVDNKTIQNSWHTLAEIPARTELSDRISIDLKKRGFKFVGSTIIYAFMQAAGLINDHLLDCFVYKELTDQQG